MSSYNVAYRKRKHLWDETCPTCFHTRVLGSTCIPPERDTHWEHAGMPRPFEYRPILYPRGRSSKFCQPARPDVTDTYDATKSSTHTHTHTNPSCTEANELLTVYTTKTEYSYTIRLQYKLYPCNILHSASCGKTCISGKQDTSGPPHVTHVRVQLHLECAYPYHHVFFSAPGMRIILSCVFNVAKKENHYQHRFVFIPRCLATCVLSKRVATLPATSWTTCRQKHVLRQIRNK